MASNLISKSTKAVVQRKEYRNARDSHAGGGVKHGGGSVGVARIKEYQL